MRHNLISAPFCYLAFSSVLISCSGQNLKGQTVTNDQGSKPAESTVQTGDQTNPYPQASESKEIAGSFLTQCDSISNSNDIGCNLYQRGDDSTVSRYTKSNYTQKIVLKGLPPDIQSYKSSTEYQKIFTLSAAQKDFIKNNQTKNPNLVTSELTGVANVSVNAGIFVNFTEPETPVAQPTLYKPYAKTSKRFYNGNLVLAPYACLAESDTFVANNVNFNIKIYQSGASPVTMNIGAAAAKIDNGKQKNDDNGNKYFLYSFGIASLKKGDVIHFSSSQLSNGYYLEMTSTDVYGPSCAIRQLSGFEAFTTLAGTVGKITDFIKEQD